MSDAFDSAWRRLEQLVNDSGGTGAEAILHAASAVATIQIDEALAGRAVIEQAKDIVMADRHCTPNDAFQVLRDLSGAANRKLADVAQALVDSASAPES